MKHLGIKNMLLVDVQSYICETSLQKSPFVGNF